MHRGIFALDRPSLACPWCIPPWPRDILCLLSLPLLLLQLLRLRGAQPLQPPVQLLMIQGLRSRPGPMLVVQGQMALEEQQRAQQGAPILLPQARLSERGVPKDCTKFRRRKSSSPHRSRQEPVRYICSVYSIRSYENIESTEMGRGHTLCIDWKEGLPNTFSQYFQREGWQTPY